MLISVNLTNASQLLKFNIHAACFSIQERLSLHHEDTGYLDLKEDFVPGGVGQRHGGARGPMSSATSWWGPQPRASPR